MTVKTGSGGVVLVVVVVVSGADVVVVDVRPGPEYAGGHLPGALHIPLEELADRLASFGHS